MGDAGRLQFIQECIAKQKPLYNTDKKYLIRKHQELETKLEILSGDKKKRSAVTEDDSDKIVDDALAKEKHARVQDIAQAKNTRRGNSRKSKRFLTGIAIGLSVSLSAGLGIVLFVSLHVR